MDAGLKGGGGRTFQKCCVACEGCDRLSRSIYAYPNPNPNPNHQANPIPNHKPNPNSSRSPHLSRSIVLVESLASVAATNSIKSPPPSPVESIPLRSMAKEEIAPQTWVKG